MGTGVFAGALALNRSSWWPAPIGVASGPGIAGSVVDLLTDSGVQALVAISSASSGIILTTATTQVDGRFGIALDPGRYELTITSPDYLSVTRTVAIDAGPPVAASFALLPANPNDAQQDLIYAKTIQQSQQPPIGDDPLEARAEVFDASVVVPDTIVVRFADGSQTTMAVDDYLRHVVPYEMPPTWGREPLRAQAVAARTYALSYARSRGYVCTTTSCQVYGSDTYRESDEAVWSTHGQVATHNGAMISAVYFAQCDGASTRNSEQAWSSASYRTTCEVGGWNYSAYLRAAACSGHSKYAYNDCGYHGHGVGMCQWGARGFGAQGWSYDQILRRFYTGIQVIRSAPQLSTPRDGYLQRTSVPLTLRWNGGSDEYQVTIIGSGGRTRSSAWISALTYSPSLPAGSYTWNVSGRSGQNSDGQSASWRFALAETIYGAPISNVKRRS